MMEIFDGIRSKMCWTLCALLMAIVLDDAFQDFLEPGAYDAV